MRCLFSCLRGFGQGGGNGNLAFQQLVHGAGIGNLQQALALLVVQLAMQGDAARGALVAVGQLDLDAGMAVRTLRMETLRLLEAMRLVASANADAIRLVADALQTPGGSEAINLKVAEQYVEAFGKLAKENNTLIMPANVADVGSLVAAGLKIVDSQKAKP